MGTCHPEFFNFMCGILCVRADTSLLQDPSSVSPMIVRIHSCGDGTRIAEMLSTAQALATVFPCPLRLGFKLDK